jgi:membrane protease YdiL (CAAX protease family)
MTEALLVGLLVAGIFGGLLFMLWSRGWMRNGYFTIGSSVLIAVVVFVIYQTVGMLLILVGSDASLTDTSPNVLLGANAIAQMLVLVGGTLLLIRATDQDYLTTLRLEGVSQTPPMLYLIAGPLMFGAQAVGQLVSIFWVRALEYLPYYDKLKALEDTQDKLMANLVSADSYPELFFVLIVVAIVPAIAEEMFFRGFLQTNLERSGHRRSRPYAALVIASFVFAAVHFSLLKLPGLLALGLAMGYMSYRTNNLIVGAFAHALNNGMIVIAMHISPGQFTNTEPDKILKENNFGDPQLLAALLFMSVMLGVGLYIFHQWSEPIEARGYAEQEVRATTAYYDANERRELGVAIDPLLSETNKTSSTHPQQDSDQQKQL